LTSRENTNMPAAKTKTKKVIEVEEEDVEEEEDEDLELDELDEDVEEEEAPAKGRKKARSSNGQQEVEFGASDLAAYLSDRTGKVITAKDLRVLIRKMAREDKPRVEREITAGNRTRYDWPGGLKNPEVKAIIAAVTGGELEAGKREALTKLKESQAAKKAAKEGKKAKKTKVKVVEPEEDEDDDDLDDLEDD
jgi:hypothetical protein